METNDKDQEQQEREDYAKECESRTNAVGATTWTIAIADAAREAARKGRESVKEKP